MKYIVIETPEGKKIYQFDSQNQKAALLNKFNDCKYKIFENHQLGESILYAQTTEIIDLSNESPDTKEIYDSIYASSTNKMQTLKSYIKNYNEKMCQTCLFEKFCPHKQDSCFCEDRLQVLPKKITTFDVRMTINTNNYSLFEWESVINKCISSAYINMFYLSFENNIDKTLINYIKDEKNYSVVIFANADDILNDNLDDVFSKLYEIIIPFTNIKEIQKCYSKLNPVGIKLSLITDSEDILKKLPSYSDFIYKIYVKNEITKIYNISKYDKTLDSFFDASQTNIPFYTDMYSIIINSSGELLYNNKAIANAINEDFSETLNLLPLDTRSFKTNIVANAKGFVDIYYDIYKTDSEMTYLRIFITNDNIKCTYALPIEDIKNNEQLDLLCLYTVLMYALYFSNIGFKPIVYTDSHKVDKYYNSLSASNIYRINKTTQFYDSEISLIKNRIWYKKIIVKYSNNLDKLNEAFQNISLSSAFSLVSNESMDRDIAELYLWEKQSTVEELKFSMVKATCKFPWDCSQCNINNKPCFCHYSGMKFKLANIGDF